MAEAMDDPAVRRDMEYEWFADGIIVQIEKKMEEMNILRQELAAKMGCTPANVTRLLRKGSNLTLRSVIDLALALDHRFLEPKLVPLAGDPWDATCARMNLPPPLLPVYRVPRPAKAPSTEGGEREKAEQPAE